MPDFHVFVLVASTNLVASLQNSWLPPSGGSSSRCPEFFRKQYDADVPAASALFLLRERDRLAIVGPRRQGEVTLEQSLRIAAVRRRDPQIPFAVDVRDAVQLGGGPRPDLAVVRCDAVRALVDDQLAEADHGLLLHPSHVGRVTHPALERGDAVHRHLRVDPGGDRAEPGRAPALRLLLPVGGRGVCLILPLLQRRRLRRDDDVAAGQRAVGIGHHALQQERAVVPGDFRKDAAVDVGRGNRHHVLPLDRLVSGGGEQGGQEQREGDHVTTSYYYQPAAWRIISRHDGARIHFSTTSASRAPAAAAIQRRWCASRYSKRRNRPRIGPASTTPSVTKPAMRMTAQGTHARAMAVHGCALAAPSAPT